MKHILVKILIFFFLLYSCKKSTPQLSSDKLDWKKINKSSDFWDYSEFIEKHPKSELFDTALYTYYKVRDEAWEENGMPIIDCFRNCADIRIINDSILLFEDQLCEIESLRKLAFDFILNEKKDINQPETKLYKIPNTKRYGEMNEGMFWIHIMNNNKSNHYLQLVVTELVAGISDYKNHVSKDWYGSNLSEISENKKALIDSLASNKLHFWKIGSGLYPPPPPPPMQEKIDKKKEN